MMRTRTKRLLLAGLAGLIVLGLGAALDAEIWPSSTPSSSAFAEGGPSVVRDAARPTIVLVHGPFADGTGWQHVIPILQHDGYAVIAVQNHLASLAEDVETTKRVMNAQQGPVVVVGHSYGGAVITGAANRCGPERIARGICPYNIHIIPSGTMRRHAGNNITAIGKPLNRITLICVN